MAITKKSIEKLSSQNYNDREIAERLGVTRQAVWKARRRFGIPAVTGALERRNKNLITMINSGLSVDDVAKEFGISKRHVYRIMQKSNGVN